VSKITHDGLTQSGTDCFNIAAPCGNSGRQRVKVKITTSRNQMSSNAHSILNDQSARLEPERVVHLLSEVTNLQRARKTW